MIPEPGARNLGPQGVELCAERNQGTRFGWVAKVVRSTEPAAAVTPRGRGAVIIEMRDARVRALIEAGVDRATLSTVLELVGKGGGR